MSDGRVAPGYEPVRDAFDAAQQADDGAAQLAVYRDGQLVVDLWTGHDPVGHAPVTGDSITLLMSVTKGLVATCVHILCERGQLDVDAPVTRYWPEFGDDVTVADLLTHRSGRSDFDPDEGIGMAELLDWDRCVTSLATMDPLWTPGSAFRYHSLTWGFLVGEVIRQITGATVGQFFADEVARPLGLDLWIGLPGSADHRFLPEFSHYRALEDDQVRAQWSELGLDLSDRLVRAAIGSVVTSGKTAEGLQTPAGRRAEVPSANGIGNARSVAKMYAATIGTIDGVRLLKPDTVEAARRSQIAELGPPAPLHLLPQGAQMRIGLGYELSHAGCPMIGPGSFGHAGAGGRLGYADPEEGVAVGYVCTNLAWDIPKGPDDRWLPWTTALNEIIRS